ncbi:MAG: hypothetical protein HY763_05580 [Planctomycetes bacterium]|nr:hypothetical protein [Planctomycetota bacterium]
MLRRNFRGRIDKRLWAGALAILVTGAVARGVSTPVYWREDISQGMTWGRGLAINNNNEAVGQWRVQGVDTAFLYAPQGNCGFSPGTHSLSVPNSEDPSLANDLNGLADAVGWYARGWFEPEPKNPVIWLCAARHGKPAGRNPVRVDLLGHGYDRGEALGINEHSDVVGTAWVSQDFPPVKSGWLWLLAANFGLSEGLYDIDPLFDHEQSYPEDINDTGLVAGTSTDEPGLAQETRAYTWDARTRETTPLALGPGQGYSKGTGLNNAGQVVGYSSDGDGVQRALRWDAGVPTELGYLQNGTGPSPAAINASGEVAGTDISPNQTNRGFLWKAGVMHELNDITFIDPASFGRDITFAGGINDYGTIVGAHYYPPGEVNISGDRPVILHRCPDADVVDAVPASGTIDARQPFPYQASPPVLMGARQGIGSPNSYSGGPEYIEVTLTGGTTGAEIAICWDLCETGIEAVESGPSLDPNFIRSVDPKPGVPGVYRLLLDRPISAGHWTTISYVPSANYVSYASYPADADAGGKATAADITTLVNYLNDPDCLTNPPAPYPTCSARHGLYSMDINHSNAVNAQDVTALVNLLNGAGTFVYWLGQPQLPPNTCPGGDMMAGGEGGEAWSEGVAGQETDDSGAFAKEFIAYLTTATPEDDAAVDEFLTIVDALTGWVLEHFTPEATATLVEMLGDPSLTFASPTATDTAAKVAEVLAQ